MSRPTDHGDDVKVELVHQRRGATRDEARRDLFAYVEGDSQPAEDPFGPGISHPDQAEQKMAS